VKKNSEIPPYRLQDITVSSDKILFFALAKIQVAAVHKVISLLKNVQNGCNFLESFFKASWLHV